MFWTEFFLEILTDVETACAAFCAVFSPIELAGSTDISPVPACVSVTTGIETVASISKNEVITYFL